MSDLSNKVEKAITELYSREQALKLALEDAAQKEHEYKLKLAQEFRKAEGTEKARTNAAMEACEKAHLDYIKADAVKAFTSQAIKDCLQVLSARQSLLTADVKSNAAYSNDKRVT